MDIKPMKRVELYADGACSGNPGRGGWAAILVYRGHERQLTGSERETTNNRMELTGVISGLEALNMPCEVTVYTDSQYVVRAVNEGWAAKWRAAGWIKPDKKPAKNPELWERLLELCGIHAVTFVWVKGHAENEYNNRCDALATETITRLKNMEKGIYPT